MKERFTIALSYSGEKRDFVSKVADELSMHLGRSKIFYDKYYESDLAHPDAALTIQKIYQDKSDLLVVFISEKYATSDWCGLEWQVIQRLIALRRVKDIMLIRFDDTVIEGVNTRLDGYLKVGKRKPKEIAEAILKRLPYQPVDNNKTTMGVEKPTSNPISKKKALMGIIVSIALIATLVWANRNGYKDNTPTSIPACKTDSIQLTDMIDSVKYDLLKKTDAHSFKPTDSKTEPVQQWLLQQQDSILERVLKKNTHGEPCYSDYKAILQDSLAKGKIIEQLRTYVMTKADLTTIINQALQNRAHSLSDSLRVTFNMTDDCQIVLVNSDSAAYTLDNFMHRQALKASYLPIRHITQLAYESGAISLIYCVQ